MSKYMKNQTGFIPFIVILGLLIISGVVIGGSAYLKDNPPSFLPKNLQQDSKVSVASPPIQKGGTAEILTPAPTSIPTIEPTQIPTSNPQITTQPQISYSISYYDIDKAQNKALADKIDLDPDRKRAIEGELLFMKASPAFINKYSIVFMSLFNYTGGQVTGILRDHQQVLVAGVYQEDPSKGIVGTVEGVADDYNKIIVLNNSLSGGELRSVFAHEFGHIVSHYLTPEEYKTFILKRGLSAEVANSWYTHIQDELSHIQQMPPLLISPWAASPAEDFAEVFKVAYGSKVSGGNWDITTNYGPVTQDQKNWFEQTVSQKFQ